MKKLVLIPYHKYQHFLSLQSNTHRGEEEKRITPQIEWETEVQPNKLNKDIILCHIPKTKRSKAEALLQYVEQSPELDWNSSGELVVNKKSIPNSHISDLVKDSVTEYKHFEPQGVGEFYRYLGNIPLTLITNPKRREFIQRGGQESLPPPPGEPEKKKIRILKTVNKGENKVWKEMWQKI